MQYKDK